MFKYELVCHKHFQSVCLCNPYFITKSSADRTRSILPFFNSNNITVFFNFFRAAFLAAPLTFNYPFSGEFINFVKFFALYLCALKNSRSYRRSVLSTSQSPGTLYEMMVFTILICPPLEYNNH